MKRQLVPFLKRTVSKKDADFFDNVFNKDKDAVLLAIESQIKRRPFSLSKHSKDELEEVKMGQSKKAPEYQKLMEQAPQIKASGLDGDYRMLAEYNNVVLAGHQTRFGVEFVTWEWVQNHTTLWQGHYYGDNYDAAKQDFVTRSGLIPTGALFTPEQLTEVYRSIHETIDNYSITPERQQYLESAADQIESIVSDLETRVDISVQEEEKFCESLNHEPGGYVFCVE